MDPLPQPPLCVLRCCNVRTWTLTSAYLFMVFCPISILHYSIKLIKNHELNLAASFSALYILMGFILFVLSIRLRSGVLQRDIAPILCWLQFCIIEAIIGTLELICNSSIDHSDVLSLVFQLLWIYPVYMYYCFERNLLQKNRDLGQQTI